MRTPERVIHLAPAFSFTSSFRHGNRLQALLDVTDARPSDLQDQAAVAQKNEIGPELDAERPPQRPAFPILDLEMLDLRVVRQARHQRRLNRLAVAAPAGSELQEN